MLFDRFAGPGWLTRQIAGNRGVITSALVGVAGAFVGFHLAILLGLLGTIVLLIAAALGAAVVLWVWRTLR